MKPIRFPPEPIMRAYMELMCQAFTCVSNNPDTSEMLFDLGDAMHNVPEMLTNYGEWMDDSKFREMYLRPFDRRWAHQAFNLEKFLNDRILQYSKE